MNDVQRGCYRDQLIVEWVQQCGALSTDQLAALLFGELPSGRRKAQQRLQRLATSGRLSRSRVAVNLPFVYHSGRLLAQAEHRVQLNWALTWLIRQLHSWERVASWEYEPDYTFLRPDMLFVAENTVTKSYRAVYVELDRSVRNRWDKAEKYARLFAEEGYRGSWWTERAERFPLIMAITSNAARMRVIRTIAERENPYGLRFDVRLLTDVQREAWPWGN